MSTASASSRRSSANHGSLNALRGAPSARHAVGSCVRGPRLMLLPGLRRLRSGSCDDVVTGTRDYVLLRLASSQRDRRRPRRKLMRGPDSVAYERAARRALPTSGLRSVRFRDDAVLKAVAAARVRLGRPGDPSHPAPIRSSGTSVARVQQALVDLGYSLPRWGVDGRYGNETYQAVLRYKRNFGIRTAGGYLDGI